MPEGLLTHFLGEVGIDTGGISLGAALRRENVRHGAKEL